MQENVLVGFVMHPLDMTDIHRFEPGTVGKSPEFVKLGMMWRKDPFHIAELDFITDLGTPVKVLVQCVMRLPEHFKQDPEEAAEIVVKAAKYLEDQNVDAIGLGAFTSIVGGQGRRVQKSVKKSTTSGNSYTVHSAVEATFKASKKLGVDLKESRVAVIGASGSIGRALLELLSWQVKGMVLVGRKEEILARLAGNYENATFSTDVEEALAISDVVFSASNDPEILIRAEDLNPGVIVCDIARPRDVAEEATKRKDLLVIEGGIIQLPGDPTWTSPFSTFTGLGLPTNHTYACFAETVLLGLESRLRTDSSLSVNLGKIPLLADTAEKHGIVPVEIREYHPSLCR